MEPVLILILAGPETHEGLGRAANALELAKELKSNNHPVEVLFDGAGTAMLAELADPGHRLHGLFAAVRDRVLGACAHCARAFGAFERLERLGLPLVAEFEGHPSLARFLKAGYRVLSF